MNAAIPKGEEVDLAPQLEGQTPEEGAVCCAMMDVEILMRGCWREDVLALHWQHGQASWD